MVESVPTVKTVLDLRSQVSAWRNQGHKIALVPTMGALHEGHLSLVDVALSSADRVIVSIFINPTQFAPHEDFDNYPRNYQADAALLQQRGAHLIYTPAAGDMYAENDATRVTVDSLSDSLCGISRPHFFTGVATIVCKLLLQALPDLAVFGEKDYQQLMVIRAMVGDLFIPTQILAGEIVREKDGLAMSSRNAYLSSSQRSAAPLLVQTLQRIAEEIIQKEDIPAVLAAAKGRLAKQGFEVDYIEVRRASTLQPVIDKVNAGEVLRIFGAVLLGTTRLIDNLEVIYPNS